ncbi:MAG: hypothetical protein ABDI20_03510, partial [Candidatus Bipolaricaulaceae bacterium]
MRNRRGVAGAKGVGVLLLGLVAVGWINSAAELEQAVSQGRALIGRQYAEFDARVIAKDIEFLTGLTLEQIGELFLTLAAAHDQGEF